MLYLPEVIESTEKITNVTANNILSIVSDLSLVVFWVSKDRNVTWHFSNMKLKRAKYDLLL